MGYEATASRVKLPEFMDAVIACEKRQLAGEKITTLDVAIAAYGDEEKEAYTNTTLRKLWKEHGDAIPFFPRPSGVGSGESRKAKNAKLMAEKVAELQAARKAATPTT